MKRNRGNRKGKIRNNKNKNDDMMMIKAAR